VDTGIASRADERRALLERHGRSYGKLHLAIAFTRGIRLADDDYKTVYGWKAAKPLPDAEFGAAFLAGRGERRNLAISLRVSGLLDVDIEGEAGRRLVARLVPNGLPPTVAIRSGHPDGDCTCGIGSRLAVRRRRSSSSRR
jgi:Bifunctional DNA primase/polymerase, N-terminal